MFKSSRHYSAETPTRPTNALKAAQESLGNFIVQSQVAEIKQKYANIDSLQRSQKEEAVKDTNLNPFLFNDPVDGLSNSMHRWTVEAPAYLHRSQQERDAVASKYYDEVLAPLYAKSGAAPLSRDIWLRSAWDAGLKYNISHAYRAPLIKGALEGFDSAVSEVANAGRTLGNILRIPLVSYIDSVRNKDFTGLTGYYNLFTRAHNRISEKGLVTGVAKTIEDYGETDIPFSPGTKWLHNISSQESFWANVSPGKTLTEKITSGVVENAMLLPLFDGITKATELGIGLASRASDGAPFIENLTQTLTASKSGQIASRMLTYGTEGLIFGNLTTDVEDKKNAWKDALQFAAMGTLFSFAGEGVSKLVDMLPEGADKKAMQDAEEESSLAAIGKRKATPEEYLQAYRAHMGSVMAASGMAGAHSVLEEALAHVALDEHASLEDIDKLKFRQDKMDEDPVRWKTVFSNMTIIRQFLDKQGWKLNAMDDTQWKSLTDFLDGQLKQAGDEIDLNVPEVKEYKAGQMLEGYLKTPEGKQAYEAELEKQQQTFAKHPKGAEMAPEMAHKEMLKKYIAAVEKAAEARTVVGAENTLKNQSLPEGVEPLPPSIRGSKTRYNYGPSNNFELSFDDPRDLTAYVLTNKGKSNAHSDFQDYYKKSFPDTTERQLSSHGDRVRNAIKIQAKNWDGEGKRTLRITSTVPIEHPTVPVEHSMPPVETARRNVASRYERDSKGKITGYQMAVSFDWKAAAIKMAKAKKRRSSDKFWTEYVNTLVKNNDDDTSVTKALAEDLREYFNPYKEYKLQFQHGDDDYTNFLAAVYQFRDQLPDPVRDVLTDALMNSPKMSKLLGSRPTMEKLDTFARAINNHIDFFTRSEWYQKKHQRHVFRSSQPGISGKGSLSKWQRDLKLIKSAFENDIKKGKTLYPGRSAAMVEARTRFETTMRALQKQQLVEYKVGKPKAVARIGNKIRAFINTGGK